MNPHGSIPAAPLDLAAELLRPVSNQTLRATIDFNGFLNAARLERCIRKLHARHPILNAALRCARRPFIWQEQEPEYPLLRQSEKKPHHTGSPSGAIHTYEPAAATDLPVDYHLTRHGLGDRLHITINHCLSDAAGLKALLYGLAGNYSGHEELNMETEPGQRSLQRLRQALPLRQRCVAVLRTRRAANHWQFPTAPVATGADEQFRQRNLTGFSIHALKARCRNTGATVNDALLSACAIALHKTGIRCTGKRAPLLFTVDLRQLLRIQQTELLANWSGSESIWLTDQDFASFETMLKVARDQTRVIKRRNPGIGSALVLEKILAAGGTHCRQMLNKSFGRIAATGMTCPLLTNFGRLEKSRLQFGDVPVRDATLRGPSLTIPGLMLSASSFGDSLTLTAGCRKDQGLDQWLAELLLTMEQQLMSFTG